MHIVYNLLPGKKKLVTKQNEHAVPDDWTRTSRLLCKVCRNKT